MLDGEAFSLCVGFLKDLIALKTVNPPGDERIAAEYIAEQLSRFGLACQVEPLAENRANVVTEPCGGEGPAILLTGHLDVVGVGEGWVTPPFRATEQDGRVYGRGACDMKGGIAAMMAAAIWAKHQGDEISPFRLAFVTDEEIYGQGTRALLATLPHADVRYAIIGEPTENEICIAHRGAIRLRIWVYGRAGHAGDPANGINAVENMARVIEAVRLVNEDSKAVRHPVLPPPTLCCTMMKAGTQDNIIPDKCELIVDGRPGVNDTAETFEKEIRGKLQAMGGLQAGVRLEMEAYINVPAGSVESDSEIVKWARARYIAAFDQEPMVQSFPACCDLSQFTRAGTPAILYGPGSIAQAHTANEFVEYTQLEQAFSFYCSCLSQV